MSFLYSMLFYGIPIIFVVPEQFLSGAEVIANLPVSGWCLNNNNKVLQQLRLQLHMQLKTDKK